MAYPPRPVRDSSGESSGPEKWFNESNNNVKRNASSLVAGESFVVPMLVLMASDDPPFFLPRSCDTTPPDNPPWPVQSVPAAADGSFATSPAGSSATAVYRNIIDDLTVENKKLKSTLKKYERAPDALFEVRVHGLSAQKKQELESLLQDFVTNIGPAPETSPDDPSNLPRTLLRPASKPRVADSGYGSSNVSALKLKTPDSAHARRKKIQNYLHELPAGILPKRSGPLTEKEKRRIVVRSLEQLFAGRDPVAGGHQHPIQQERVAQSAARADRRATAAALPEGPREAHIMPSDPLRQPPEPSTKESASPGYQEQRPTRPLDLDPHRAQIPAENMEYIRHLGFSPPDAATMEANADSQGWVSLIVLINMAQLHYTSVTPEFVRKSISDHSEMLELSADGRRVRWKGGKYVTKSSSGSSPDEVGVGAKSPFSKGAVPNPMSSSDGSYFSINRKLAYSPLFHSRDDSEDGRTGDASPPYQTSNAVGRSSVQTGSDPRSLAGGGAQGSVADDGPIIFYRNAAFYTDLSGSHGGGRPPRSSAYKRFESRPIGSESSTARLELLRRLEYEKGPLSRAEDPPDDGEGDSATSAGPPLEVIPAGARNGKASPDDTPSPIDLEASGVGGVRPADNFAISVRSRQLKAGPGARPAAAGGSGAYPARIRDALGRAGPRGPAGGARARAPARPVVVVDRQIVGSKRRELPASRLPEAVYLHASSSDDDDGSGDGGGSEGGTSEAGVTPDSRRMDWMAKYRGPGSECDDEGETSEEGEVPSASSSSSEEEDGEDEEIGSEEDRPAVVLPKEPAFPCLKRPRQSNESVLVHLSRPPKSPKLEQSRE
jgi:hypothetical protein